MAVKDFKVEEGKKAVVCNASGKLFKLDKLTQKVANALVIGSDTFRNELGEEVTYIWID